MTGMFGGGSKRNLAAEEAAKTREENRIAQERQLAAENAADKGASGSRKAPKGRRLFEELETALSGGGGTLGNSK